MSHGTQRSQTHLFYFCVCVCVGGDPQFKPHDRYRHYTGWNTRSGIAPEISVDHTENSPFLQYFGQTPLISYYFWPVKLKNIYNLAIICSHKRQIFTIFTYLYQGNYSFSQPLPFLMLHRWLHVHLVYSYRLCKLMSKINILKSQWINSRMILKHQQQSPSGNKVLTLQHRWSVFIFLH